jgi:hypothetical protein
MILYFPNGGLREIAGWSKYDCELGADWALVMQKEMEKKAAQAIPVNKE